jgi:DmsE family decaheme c-type cytochrome
MNMHKPLLGLALALLGLGWQVPSRAQADAAAAPASAASAASVVMASPGTQYTDKGADTCIECHDEDSASYSTTALFRSPHAHRGNARAPFGPGGLQCEACHGPGANHAKKGSKKLLTINTFKADSFLSVEQRNEPCMACHQGSTRQAWHAGAHERSRLACTDCHRMHVEKDAVLAKATQPDVCLACHKQQRADFLKASTHPVRQGRMGCSDCHNAHGSSGPAMLIKPTLNQTCTSCHADKRGPLLWEHAPVAEDCSLCHNSHGSVRTALLSKTPPLLCQQCHATAGHPSVSRTGADLPGNGGTGAVFVIAGSCSNCHTQVHGSNHPSGAKLMR